MEHGMLGGRLLTREQLKTKSGDGAVLESSERWITQIQGGVVTLLQRLQADSLVVQAQDLPQLCANDELVDLDLLKLIREVVRDRLK